MDEPVKPPTICSEIGNAALKGKTQIQLSAKPYADPGPFEKHWTNDVDKDNLLVYSIAGDTYLQIEPESTLPHGGYRFFKIFYGDRSWEANYEIPGTSPSCIVNIPQPRGVRMDVKRVYAYR